MRWTIGISLAALCSVPLGCDRSSSTVSDAPPNLPQGDPSSRPAPPPTAIELGSTLQKIQKRAEDGDLSSMITLARTLEGMGGAHRDEARKWYQKASEKGDRSAKEAIQAMDAADVAARHSTEAVPSAPIPKAPAADTNSTDSGKSAGPPTDLSKLRWQDVIGSLDNHDFSTVTQPNFHKRGDDNPMFVAVSSSNDKMLTVAASGADDGNIDAVSIVLRIRTRENLGQNDRVSQAHSICDAVTRGNVMPNDLLDWLGQYLQTGKKTVPVFRNGWSITVSGTDAEGIADPKKFLGEAVLIEMKK